MTARDVCCVRDDGGRVGVRVNEDVYLAAEARARVDLAVDNGGYVTLTLVADHGVPTVELRKMESRGTLQAASRMRDDLDCQHRLRRAQLCPRCTGACSRRSTPWT